jgi:hypothetical protein
MPSSSRRVGEKPTNFCGVKLEEDAVPTDAARVSLTAIEADAWAKVARRGT